MSGTLTADLIGRSLLAGAGRRFMTEEQLKARAIELIRYLVDNDFYFHLVETGAKESDAEKINRLISDATVTVQFDGSSTKFVIQ
jgi:hypothetical protein